MLFTRCPDCDTTFRVTDDALAKANGQVRCGRCASVFNAYAERRDVAGEPPPEAPEAEPLPVVAPESAPPSADPIEALSVADVVAQIEQVALDEDEDTGEFAALEAVNDDAIPPVQVEAVLETEAIVDSRRGLWEPRRRSAWWGAGALAALLALALQSVNHYRADLVKQPAVGSLVRSAYSALGITVTPHWDVRQYEILDWVATAAPGNGGLGSLKIAARIKNRGPDYQPYPEVNLRLKNRWEVAVGSRTFAPPEYLAAAPRRLMAPGETARAQLEVVDPGPDAYGFELDVCIEVETHVLSCGSDKVFL
ncbi:MAG TPA: zinc-ribbon and DUF3426 domain-containing protein [Gammaproteobacteria bacterium]|nr:zinc-ribbon and DUF3426 domain-containing protein [Gammaproteobacteria bacterium]